LGAEIANRGPLDRHCNGRRILGMCRFRDERREMVTTLLVDQVPEDVLMVGFSDDRDPVATAIPHRSPLAAWRRLGVAGAVEQLSQRAGTLLAGVDGATVHMTSGL